MSKQCLTFRYRIRSWRDESGRSAENTWTTHYSGRPPMWRTNSDSSRITSIDTEFTRAYEDGYPIRRKGPRHYTLIHIGGSNTVATSIRRPSPRDLRNSPMTGLVFDTLK